MYATHRLPEDKSFKITDDTTEANAGQMLGFVAQQAKDYCCTLSHPRLVSLHNHVNMSSLTHSKINLQVLVIMHFLLFLLCKEIY